MMKKLLFGLMWFVIIFMVSYLATGVTVVLLAGGIESNQAMYEAAQAFRNTYMIFFVIGSLILTVAGTVTGVLPGTKRKASAKKKPSTKKKARKKRKR
jgi:heme/copper-type cytochrome/quinol oxidase subunit 2